MKNIFRITCAILTAIFLSGVCATVSAFTNNWVDTNYDFTKVHKIFFCETDTNALLTLNESINNDLRAYVIKKFKNFDVTFEGIIDSNVNSDNKYIDNPDLTELKIKVKILKYDKAFHHTEPEKTTKIVHHYEGWEEIRTHTRNKKGNLVEKKDKKWKTSGSWFHGSRKVEVNKVTPAHDVYNLRVKMIFEVYDSASQELVLERVEDVNTSSSNPDGQIKMYKEMYEDFFDVFKIHLEFKQNQKLVGGA